MKANAGLTVSPVPTRRAVCRSALLAVLAVLLLPALVGAEPDSTPAEQAVAVVQPATVSVETSWAAWVNDHDGDWLNDGQPYEWTVGCSGFVVKPSGYIVTAGHCVDDSLDYGARWEAISFGVDEWVDRGWASPDEADELLELAYGNWLVEGQGTGTPPERTVLVTHGWATSGLATETWSARVIEVMSLSDGDVALLKVEGSELPTIQVDSDVSLTIGTPVLAVGYPASSELVTDQSLEPTFKDGTISSTRTRGDGLLPVYEVSAALTGGMSGGPAINHAGEVIGVNSFSVEGETQPFNFLTPASLVSEMLTRNGVSSPCSTASSTESVTASCTPGRLLRSLPRPARWFRAMSRTMLRSSLSTTSCRDRPCGPSSNFISASTWGSIPRSWTTGSRGRASRLASSLISPSARPGLASCISRRSMRRATRDLALPS
jgi:S1-C subfamily serine protease